MRCSESFVKKNPIITIQTIKKILFQFLGRENVEIIPYALGETSGMVHMGIPAGEQPCRHGLTCILTGRNEEEPVITFEVEIRSPSTQFVQLDRLDYFKCDVEGYEDKVLPPMQPLICRFRPLVQVELAPENRPAIFQFFHAEDYQAFALRNQRLYLLDGARQQAPGDLLFVPEERVEELGIWMENG